MDESLRDAHRDASAAPDDAEARLSYSRELFRAGYRMGGLHEAQAAARGLGKEAVRGLIKDQARVPHPGTGELLPLERSGRSAPPLDEVIGPMPDEDYPGAWVSGVTPLLGSPNYKTKESLLFLGAESCRACDGVGRDECEYCGGMGTYMRMSPHKQTCRVCRGEGDFPCVGCYGHGREIGRGELASDCAHEWVEGEEKIAEWEVVRCSQCSLAALRRTEGDHPQLHVACSSCRRFGCACGRQSPGP